MSAIKILLLTTMFAQYNAGDAVVMPAAPTVTAQERCLAQEVSNLSCDQVLRWGTQAHIVPNLKPNEVLALIHVESTGDPYAQRARSRYYGLLQISRPYLKDALDYAGKSGWSISSLRGNGRRSLIVFNWYMKRYDSLHDWDPNKVALLHKMGPSDFRKALRKAGRGLGFSDAVCVSASPNACEYLRRFEVLSHAYGKILNPDTGDT